MTSNFSSILLLFADELDLLDLMIQASSVIKQFILSTIISDSTCVYMLNTTQKCLHFQVHKSVLLRGLLHLHLKRNLVENTIRGKWCNFTFMHTKVNPHHETKRIFFEISSFRVPGERSFNVQLWSHARFIILLLRIPDVHYNDVNLNHWTMLKVSRNQLFFMNSMRFSIIRKNKLP